MIRPAPIRCVRRKCLQALDFDGERLHHAATDPEPEEPIMPAVGTRPASALKQTGSAC